MIAEAAMIAFLNRQMLEFTVDRAVMQWQICQEKTGVDEALELSLEVTTQPWDSEVEAFTVRYPTADVSVRPRRNKTDKTDDDRSLVGVVLQHDGHLAIRLLVRPHYLAALASVFSAPAHPPATLHVSVPRDQLSVWDGAHFLPVAEASLTFGPVTGGTPMRQDWDGYLRTRRQLERWPMGPAGGFMGGIAYTAAFEGRWIMALVGGVLSLLLLWMAYPKRQDVDRT
jgi:hypothetical protein